MQEREKGIVSQALTAYTCARVPLERTRLPRSHEHPRVAELPAAPETCCGIPAGSRKRRLGVAALGAACVMLVGQQGEGRAGEGGHGSLSAAARRVGGAGVWLLWSAAHLVTVLGGVVDGRWCGFGSREEGEWAFQRSERGELICEARAAPRDERRRPRLLYHSVRHGRVIAR